MFVSCLVRLKVLGSYAAILFVLDDLAAVWLSMSTEIFILSDFLVHFKEHGRAV
jgi:hypothetical protein